MRNVSQTTPKTFRKYTRLNPKQWALAVDSYELGEGTAKAIAMRFGVCDRTMRDGLKARGAIKGRRAYEGQEELIKAIKEEHRIRDQARREIEEAAWARCNVTAEAMGKMMEALAHKFGAGPIDQGFIAAFAKLDLMEESLDLDVSF